MKNVFSVYLAFFLCFSLSSCSKERYVVDEVIEPIISDECSKNIQQHIIFAKQNVEKIINSYLNTINKEVKNEYADSFIFTKTMKISSHVLFSSIDGTFLYIYPDKKNDMIIDYTDLPVQNFLFSGKDLYNILKHSNNLYGRDVELYPVSILYMTSPETPLFSVKHPQSIIWLENLGFINSYPKLFDLAKNSIIVTKNVAFQYLVDNKIKRDSHIKYIGLFISEGSFKYALSKADSLGIELAHEEIKQLFISSKYFRVLLSYDRLLPLAKIILQKVSRSEKDPDYNYPFPKFKREVAQLKNIAKKLKIHTKFVDKILKEKQLEPNDGYFLWYYSTHFEFTVQWSILNILLLVLITFLILINRFKQFSITKIIYRYTVTIVIAINGWVIYSKPYNLNIIYYLIPGIMFIACILLSFYKMNVQEHS